MATGKKVLLADIGGTNARFALYDTSDPPAPDALAQLRQLTCAHFPRLDAALWHYLSQTGLQTSDLYAAVLAVAGPLSDDCIQLTNNPWRLDRRQLADDLSLQIDLLNDFQAQAWCLSAMHTLPRCCINTGRANGGNRSIVGPGTGFGAATLGASGEILVSEAGHAAFAPLDQQQLALLQQLWQWYPRVSIEHLLSGPGLANLYAALSSIAGQAMTPQTAPASHAIVQQANQPLAANTLQCFSRILGAVCGDLALIQASRGGVVLSGALLQGMSRHFDEGEFMQSFTNKGAFSDYCADIPVSLLLVEHPGLLGCALYAHHNQIAVAAS